MEIKVFTKEEREAINRYLEINRNQQKEKNRLPYLLHLVKHGHCGIECSTKCCFLKVKSFGLPECELTRSKKYVDKQSFSSLETNKLLGRKELAEVIFRR